MCDESDMEEKVRCMYARSKALSRKFYFCSDKVKNKLFSYYCSNIDLCSLWVKFRKSAMKQLVVAYNNAFRIMHNAMFANARVDNCEARIRKCI